MNLISLIQEHFQESIQIKTASMENLCDKIAKVGQLMIQCLSSQHKILSCGNGGSACDSFHFTGELLNRLEKERRPLAALTLTADAVSMTAISNDYSFDQIFSKQVEALGQSNDILLAFSTSGNSKNVINAINIAHEKNMPVVALTGKGGGMISKLLTKDDIEICVPSNRTMRIQEVHEVIIHALCDLIEKQLFGE